MDLVNRLRTPHLAGEWPYNGHVSQMKDSEEAAKIIEKALEWRAARQGFLALPSSSPDARSALNRLSNAEDALSKALAE